MISASSFGKTALYYHRMSGRTDCICYGKVVSRTWACLFLLSVCVVKVQHSDLANVLLFPFFLFPKKDRTQLRVIFLFDLGCRQSSKRVDVYNANTYERPSLPLVSFPNPMLLTPPQWRKDILAAVYCKKYQCLVMKVFLCKEMEFPI